MKLIENFYQLSIRIIGTGGSQKILYSCSEVTPQLGTAVSSVSAKYKNGAAKQ